MTGKFNYRPAVKEAGPKIIELRRTIHQWPELAFQEHQTSKVVQKVFADNGLKYYTGFGQTGVAALWDSGEPGPTLAIRAEMDALKVQESDSCPFASKNPGIMHACGHDINLAVAAGLSYLIPAMAGKIKGRVMIICQPAEENGPGALAMLNDGLYEKVATPDFIFSGHTNPAHELGRVMINPKATLAGTLDYTIKVNGKGGHAAMPEKANNPLPGIAKLLLAIDSYQRPADALITATVVEGSQLPNVIPPSASLGGTLRYHYYEARETIMAFVNQAIKKVEAEGGYQIETIIKEGYPPTINDQTQSELLSKVAAGLVGEGLVFPEPPSFGGEDFSYFLQKTLGAFMFVGAAIPGVTSGPLHSAQVDFNEEVVYVMSELWLRLIETVLAK